MSIQLYATEAILRSKYISIPLIGYGINQFKACRSCSIPHVVKISFINFVSSCVRSSACSGTSKTLSMISETSDDMEWEKVRVG